MQRYKNINRNSGVVAYEIQKDSIIVEFIDGEKYLYNKTKPGKTKVEEMKKLAKSGKGLSGYISTHVRENYAKKLV